MRRFISLTVGGALLCLPAVAPSQRTPPPRSPAESGTTKTWMGRDSLNSLVTYLPGLPRQAEPPLDVVGGKAVLTPQGYNDIRIGASLKAAQKRYSLRTSQEDAFDDSCRLYTAAETPGLVAYVQHGKITRVSISHVRLGALVWVPPIVRTERGIGIESSLAEVRAAHADARPVRAGGDLYTPASATTPGLRFNFDADRRVSEMSAGVMPALQLREGCL